MISSAQCVRLGGRSVVLVVVLPLRVARAPPQQTYSSFYPYLHKTKRKRDNSKSKKIWKEKYFALRFPKGFKGKGKKTEPVFLVIALSGQNGIPHRHVHIYPLSWGHLLEEVQIPSSLYGWIPSFLSSTYRFKLI